MRGAFLQVVNKFDEAFWHQAVFEMSELGMNAAIIQTEAYLTEYNTLNSVKPSLINAVIV